MDRPAAERAQLLASWMEWEKVAATPGSLLKELEPGGLRDILEEMSASSPADS